MFEGDLEVCICVVGSPVIGNIIVINTQLCRVRVRWG